MILFRSPTVKRHTLRVVRNENFWKQMIFRAWPLKDTVRKIQREERRLASRLLEARTSCRTWTLEVLSRREIAAAVNFHSAQISRGVKRGFGLSAGEYLRRLRLEDATPTNRGNYHASGGDHSRFGLHGPSALSCVFRYYKASAHRSTERQQSK